MTHFETFKYKNLFLSLQSNSRGRKLYWSTKENRLVRSIRQRLHRPVYREVLYKWAMPSSKGI